MNILQKNSLNFFNRLKNDCCNFRKAWFPLWSNVRQLEIIFMRRFFSCCDHFDSHVFSIRNPIFHWKWCDPCFTSTNYWRWKTICLRKSRMSIQNSVKHLTSSFLRKESTIVDNFYKKLYFRCLTGFWIRLWKLLF